jgi:hypothetical protein
MGTATHTNSEIAIDGRPVKGRPLSGRIWKTSYDRAFSRVSMQTLHSTFQGRRQRELDAKLQREREREMKEEVSMERQVEHFN